MRWRREPKHMNTEVLGSYNGFGPGDEVAAAKVYGRYRIGRLYRECSSGQVLADLIGVSKGADAARTRPVTSLRLVRKAHPNAA